jgi:hypothetical protein
MMTTLPAFGLKCIPLLGTSNPNTQRYTRRWNFLMQGGCTAAGPPGLVPSGTVGSATGRTARCDRGGLLIRVEP